MITYIKAELTFCPVVLILSKFIREYLNKEDQLL